MSTGTKDLDSLDTRTGHGGQSVNGAHAQEDLCPISKLLLRTMDDRS